MDIPVEISTALIQLVVAVIGIGTVFITAYGTKWIRANIKNEEFKKNALTVVDTLKASVNSTIALLGDETKKKLADGKLTREEVIAIQNTAVSHLKKQVPAYEALLADNIQDVQGWVVNKVTEQIAVADKVTGVN